MSERKHRVSLGPEPRIPKITYADIIHRVREKLGCGSERIPEAPFPFQWCWWPDGPDLRDQLRSDYGLGTDFPDLEKEFQEEVEGITEALKELGWKLDAPDAPSRLNQTLKLRATALSIWAEIAMPIRRRGEIIFRLWPPRDVFGSPIIQSLPLDEYLIGATMISAEYSLQIKRLTESLRTWRLTAILSISLISATVVLHFIKGEVGAVVTMAVVGAIFLLAHLKSWI